jgi:hypothetical protein
MGGAGGTGGGGAPLAFGPSTGGGARILAMQDDLQVESAYYQRFDVCPRPSDQTSFRPKMALRAR